MRELDINNWNRKELFKHFRTLADPTFAVVVDFDVTFTYNSAKENKQSFFVRYLHACMKAINSVENFKYRIVDDKVVIFDTINASATIAREDTTYGFSFIKFSADFNQFNANFLKEKERIQNSTDLFPPAYSLGCIHCSANPWYSFTSHKEPLSGDKNDSVPQLAFGKVKKAQNKLLMPVAINVNHALVDGYHVGLFTQRFQENLNIF